MNYKLVIFDWDGTLMDSVSRIVSSMQAAARLSGEPASSFDEVKNIIGLSLDIAIERLFPHACNVTRQSIFDQYKDHYVNHDQTPTPMFTGAVELLTSLNDEGYKLAVATGKGRQGLQRVWQISQTEHLFHTSCCADEAISKPSPDMLNKILTELSLHPHEAVMIGDTEYDLAMAGAIGMDRIGVSFGVHSSAQLQQHSPIAVVDSLHELKALL